MVYADIMGANPNIRCSSTACQKRCTDNPGFHVKGNYCNTTDSSDATGAFAWEVTEGGNDFGGSIPNTLHVSSKAYPPYTGEYVLKWYLCRADSSGSAPCTAGASFTNAMTIKPLKLSSTISLTTGQYHAGGQMGTLEAPGNGFYNWCATLVSSKDGSEYFVEGQPLFCQDVNPMPVEPSSCVINSGRPLDVDFGVLDRNRDINHSSEKVVKNYDIPVVCSGGASMDVSVSFESGTGVLSVGGYNTIGTNIPGLGVGVSYNGKMVDINESKIEQSFSPGISDIALGFSVVAENPNKIVPGDFSASGVMTITKN